MDFATSFTSLVYSFTGHGWNLRMNYMPPFCSVLLWLDLRLDFNEFHCHFITMNLLTKRKQAKFSTREEKALGYHQNINKGTKSRVFHHINGCLNRQRLRVHVSSIICYMRNCPSVFHYSQFSKWPRKVPKKHIR